MKALDLIPINDCFTRIVKLRIVKLQSAITVVSKSIGNLDHMYK